MKSTLYIIITIICLSISSCDKINTIHEGESNVQENKIKFSQLTVMKSHGIKLFYKDNVLFSGEAWSSDGITVCIICQNGRLLEIQGKNPNSTNAVVVNLRPGQEFHNGGLFDTFNEVVYLNDGNGNLIQRLGKLPNGWRHECYGGITETITNQNYIQDVYPSHAQLLETYEAILDNEIHTIK